MSCLWLRASDPYFDELSVSTEAEKDRLNRLIKSAISYVEDRYCRRKLAEAEYDEVARAKQGAIVLRNFPVKYITRICVGELPAITIHNDSSSVSNASWSVDQTSLRMTHYANGVRITNVLSLADSPTLSVLASAIADAGWTVAVAHGYEQRPSIDLVAYQAGNGKNANNVYLWDDYSGSFQFDERTGIIDGAFADRGRIRVVYTAGYLPVPEDLRQATAHLVIQGYSGTPVQSENLGGYSYSLVDVDKLPMSDKKVLSLYRDRGC